jgi:hypothetical protein
MNEQKVFVCLVAKDYPLRIRKASLDLDIRAIKFKTWFLGERQMFVVPDGVEPYPYKKKNLLYFADPVKKVCVGLGGVTGEVSAQLEAKLKLYSRNKFWQFVGGRALGLMETLIYLGAGYGFLRFAEYVLTSIFK